jgi:hypothetical protein
MSMPNGLSQKDAARQAVERMWRTGQIDDHEETQELANEIYGGYVQFNVISTQRAAIRREKEGKTLKINKRQKSFDQSCDCFKLAIELSTVLKKHKLKVEDLLEIFENFDDLNDLKSLCSAIVEFRAAA